VKNMEYTFRKATVEDLDGVETIYNHIHDMEEAGVFTTGWERGVYPVRETAEKALSRGDLYVCESDGKILASAILNNLQDEYYKECNWLYEAEDKDVSVLHTLVVEPSLGKQNIGTEFVKYWENLAKEEGYKVLRMDTNVRNKIARHFYATKGYREVGTVQTVFNGIPGLELVMMEKKL